MTNNGLKQNKLHFSLTFHSKQFVVGLENDYASLGGLYHSFSLHEKVYVCEKYIYLLCTHYVLCTMQHIFSMRLGAMQPCGTVYSDSILILCCLNEHTNATVYSCFWCLLYHKSSLYCYHISHMPLCWMIHFHGYERDRESWLFHKTRHMRNIIEVYVITLLLVRINLWLLCMFTH